MKEINQWEQNSIKKIQKAANDAREQLLNLLGTATNNDVSTTLEPFVKELTTARDDDAFVETDLQLWTTKLNKLKDDFNASKTILIKRDAYSGRTFIHPILTIAIPHDFFGYSLGNIEIEDNEYVIKQGFLPPAGSARTMNEYSFGCHQFRFMIENLQTNYDRKWIFFGIVSKATAVPTQSYTAPTVYGWAGRNEFFYNGGKSVDSQSYESDMEKNDILQLYSSIVVGKRFD